VLIRFLLQIYEKILNVADNRVLFVFLLGIFIIFIPFLM